MQFPRGGGERQIVLRLEFTRNLEHKEVHMPQPKAIHSTRAHARSLLQKVVFWGLHLGIVVFCTWLLFFGGLSSLSGGLLTFADPVRAKILLCCATFYALRHGWTLFYLLRRHVPWGEVFGLLIFMALFEVGLLLLGGGVWTAKVAPLGWQDAVASILLLAGSFLNSFSEMQRKGWKAKTENSGRCYTRGLFAYSMHINFFGDVVLFTGWCLLTQNLWTLILPLAMYLSFVFFHIPGLDAYLTDRYGKEFEDYAGRTKKMVPFVY